MDRVQRNEYNRGYSLAMRGGSMDMVSASIWFKKGYRDAIDAKRKAYRNG